MAKAVRAGLRVVKYGLGIAAWFVGVGIVILETAWFFNRDPSAESEVRKLMTTAGVAHAVEVGDCHYSEADSVDSYYWCELRVSTRVRVTDGNGQATTFRRGTSRFCFHVPRAANGDSDFAASLLHPLPAEGRC